MSYVSDCLSVLKSTGLPILEVVLPEREYNRLEFEILRRQRIIELCSISEDRTAITFLGIKISKPKATITPKEL